MNERGTPLDFLQDVMDCEELPLSTRMRAAIAAAPYRHPKLAATMVLDGSDLKSRLERAYAASEGINAARAKGFDELVKFVRTLPEPKVIEGEAIKEEEPVGSSEDIADR